SLKGFGSLDARRDVRKGGDDATVRHAVRAHLYDHALGETLEERLVARNVAFDLRAEELFGVVVGARSAPSVEAQDVGKADASANQTRWQIQDFAELAGATDPDQGPVEEREGPARHAASGL